MVLEPSLNVIVPVGMPLPGDTTLTVAVKVNDCPKTEGLFPLVRPIAVVVLAWSTVWETPVETLE